MNHRDELISESGSYRTIAKHEEFFTLVQMHGST